jgi:RNA polymerase sigma factor (sigma-70 family)
MEDYIILKIDIKRALKSLKLKERLIIKLLFCEGYSENEAAKRVKVGRSRIRNIKSSALLKLKEILL